MNQKKKSRPKKRAAGLVIAAPVPRPASADDPSLKLFREAKEAQEQQQQRQQITGVPEYRSTGVAESHTVNSKELTDSGALAITGVPEYRSNQQIIPGKNFYRKANKTADQLDKTLSPAESKVLDHLLRLSVGFNKKTCQVRVSKLLQRTGYRSDKTVRGALTRLEMKGIIKRLSHDNNPSGGLYEIYGYSGSSGVPEYSGTPVTLDSGTPVKITGVTPVKITGAIDIKTTVLKDKKKDDDDEASAGLLALLEQAAVEMTGKEAQAGEHDQWRELGELLVTELRIAGARTTVSNVPAFLTEHLRRRLWKTDKKQMGVEGKSASTDEKPSLSIEKARDCPDCGGTGFFYPNGFEGGVARCKHQRLAKEK